MNHLQRENKTIIHDLNQTNDDENIKSKMQINKENIIKFQMNLDHLQQDYNAIFSKRASLLNVIYLKNGLLIIKFRRSEMKNKKKFKIFY